LELKSKRVVRHTFAEIDAAGWLAGVRRIESPNFDLRPSEESISLVVVHAISLPPSQFGSDDIHRLFTNTLDPGAHPYFAQISALRVSAHFLISRHGDLIQFVSCLHRAWHAGVSCWDGHERCNDFSIGIELEGCDELPFEAVQYTRLVALIEALKSRYSVSSVVGHSDIAPGRKRDPGPCFEWRNLSSLGEVVAALR
jgi:AmpD protein